MMRGYGFSFHLGGVQTSTPVQPAKRRRREKFHPLVVEFERQVDIFRSLHPERHCDDEQMPLNSNITKWRKAASAAMGLDEYQRFGGHFKTVIWVSCFSKRCYQQAQLIMTELRATRQKVNGNLFEGCCGLTDEPALYGLLRRMAQGQLSKEEFAKEGAREKRQLKTRDAVNTENVLQRRIDILEAENRRLKVQLSELRKKLPEEPQQSEQRGPEAAAIFTSDAEVAPSQTNRHPASTSIIETDVTPAKIDNQPTRISQFADGKRVSPTHGTSRDNTVYNFHDTSPMPSPPKRRERKRKATYKVTYKPTTDSSEDLHEDLHDSDNDPGWVRGKNEKSSSEEEEDIYEDDRMNKAFVATPIHCPDEDEGPRVRLNPLYREDINLTLPQKPGHGQLTEEDEEKEEEERVHTTETVVAVVGRRNSRSRTSEIKTFKKGEAIQALYVDGGKDKWSDWLDCTVLQVIMAGSMYQVRFDVDNAVQMVRRSHVRPRE